MDVEDEVLETVVDEEVDELVDVLVDVDDDDSVVTIRSRSHTNARRRLHRKSVHSF